jgi:nucleoside-diphosphate-sugar epimerase
LARILIAGCGDLGAALAQPLLADGHRVLGLRRRAAELPAGVEPVAADLADAAGLAAALDRLGVEGVDALVYTAAADGADDLAYRRAYVDGLRNAIGWAAGRPRPPWVLFTSSTAVFAQRDGSWVDEESPTEPTQFRGVRMLEAERALAASGLPAVTVRLGGLYGPGRTRLIERVRAGRASIRPGPPRWTNRIHRADAAGALRHLLEAALRGEPGASLYVGVDDEPADEAEVVRWLAARLGAPPPRLAADAESGGEGDASNRRCRNARLRATGYRFRFPTFREGYADVIAGMAAPAPAPPTPR